MCSARSVYPRYTMHQLTPPRLSTRMYGGNWSSAQLRSDPKNKTAYKNDGGGGCIADDDDGGGCCIDDDGDVDCAMVLLFTKFFFTVYNS